MAHLVTGYAGSEHIKSADQAAFNAAFFGSGQYVMMQGNKFAASFSNEMNTIVRILDGEMLMQGRHIRIEPGSHEDLTIELGTSTTLRYDLIVMEYTKDSVSGIESAQLKVLKGTPKSTQAGLKEPECTTGNLLEGDSVNQMPLYRVEIIGIKPQRIVQLFKTIGDLSSMAAAAADVYEQDTAEAKEAITADFNALKKEVANIKAIRSAALKETINNVYGGKAFIFQMANIIIIQLDNWQVTGAANTSNLFTYSSAIPAPLYDNSQYFTTSDKVSEAIIKVSAGSRSIEFYSNRGVCYSGQLIFLAKSSGESENVFNSAIVDALPTENIDIYTIYFLRNSNAESEENKYTEYMYINGGWEVLGGNGYSKEVLDSKFEQLFQSVSNGKTLIASAITDKGIATDATATFQEMAGNIGQISGGSKAVNVYGSTCVHESQTCTATATLHVEPDGPIIDRP